MPDMNKVPEVVLWREVIRNAVIDAGISLSNGKASYSPASSSRSENLDRRQALHFLTDDTGCWKTSRKLVCENAMVCPERLRKNVLHILAKFNPTK